MADTLALFPDLAAAAPVAGLRYEEGVLSSEAQAGFLDWVPSLALTAFDFRGFKGARRIASFGSRYDFTQSRVRPAEPLPEALMPMRGAAAAFAGLPETALAQALVTEYAPGAGIGWHRDRPEYGQVVGLSFVSECVLRFRRPEDGGWRRAAQILRPGSTFSSTDPPATPGSTASFRARRFAIL